MYLNALRIAHKIFSFTLFYKNFTISSLIHSKSRKNSSEKYFHFTFSNEIAFFTQELLKKLQFAFFNGENFLNFFSQHILLQSVNGNHIRLRRYPIQLQLIASTANGSELGCVPKMLMSSLLLWKHTIESDSQYCLYVSMCSASNTASIMWAINATISDSVQRSYYAFVLSVHVCVYWCGCVCVCVSGHWLVQPGYALTRFGAVCTNFDLTRKNVDGILLRPHFTHFPCSTLSSL